MIRRIAGLLRSSPTLGRWALRCTPDLKITANLDGIGRMRIRIRRHRSYWLRDPLAADHRMLGYIHQLFRPGQCVYDIGANIGLYSRILTRAFGAAWVVACEPMRENLTMLRENIALDPLTAERTQIVDAAIADTDGAELFQVDDMMSQSASLDRVTGGKPASGRAQYGLAGLTETVKTTRLDTLVEGSKVPIPDLIKIDVEGAELLVLKGARNTLETHHPNLAIEFHHLDTTRDCLSLLDDHGYFIYGHLLGDNSMDYCRVRREDLERRTSAYDFHLCVASTDEGLLRALPEPFNLTAAIGRRERHQSDGTC